jgi:ubiquinone/menaquinone biosynthesis C-methylase UbiE
VLPGARIPFADASFDAIFCSEVIEHVYDPEFVFSEFSRLLRDQGLLMITTPYHARMKNVAVALFFFERHFDPTGQHIRFWTKRSLTKIAEAHHFIPTSWSHVGRHWPFPMSFFLICRRSSRP